MNAKCNFLMFAQIQDADQNKNHKKIWTTIFSCEFLYNSRVLV